MSKKPPNIAVGDRVAYSANFLRSTGQLTGAVPFMRGTVVRLDDWCGAVFAAVEWHGFDGEKMVNAFALARVGSAAMCAL